MVPHKGNYLIKCRCGPFLINLIEEEDDLVKITGGQPIIMVNKPRINFPCFRKVPQVFTSISSSPGRNSNEGLFIGGHPLTRHDIRPVD